MTTIEKERQRLRQLRGYYGHLKRADSRTRTKFGEIFLGEPKRACLEPLLEETRGDIEEAERRIRRTVADGASARRGGGVRDGTARGGPRVRTVDGVIAAQETAHNGGHR